MDFIKQGKSNFTIVIPEKDNEAAGFAAEELKKYVELSTGAVLDIKTVDLSDEENKFFIGGFFPAQSSVINMKNVDLNDDGFVLNITNKNICINAQNGRGVIYGVYRFLEKYFGIRFYTPDCEKVPKLDTVFVQPDLIIERPAFAMRSYLVGPVWLANESLAPFYLKLKQNNEHFRINGEQISDKKYGGRCPMWGRGGTHNMCQFVPRDKWAESHPEFYVFMPETELYTIDLQNGITEDGKLDESMDVSIAKIVIEEMKKDILAHPDIIYFQFEQEDGGTMYPYEEGTWQHKVLEKYGRSGILIRFCNVLASAIDKWAKEELDGRKVVIVTFAYGPTRFAPVKEENGKLVPIDDTVIPVDNLLLRVAVGSNEAYPRFDYEKQIKHLEPFKGWEVLANKFMIWTYDKDEIDLIWYHPTMKIIKRSVESYRAKGFVYLMYESAIGCSKTTIGDKSHLAESDAPTHRWWQTDIKNYIISNLMWNPDLSVNDLFNDYVEDYYTIVSDHVKRITAILENYSVFASSVYKDYIIGCIGGWNYRHTDLYNLPLLDRLHNIVLDAEKIIKNADISEEERKTVAYRFAQVSSTVVRMKAIKLNHEMIDRINNADIRRFAGVRAVPEIEPCTFFTPEYKSDLVIPDDVKEKINNLDPMSISDTIDFDNIY